MPEKKQWSTERMRKERDVLNAGMTSLTDGKAGNSAVTDARTPGTTEEQGERGLQSRV